MMDSKARRWGRSPADLLGLAPGSWAAAIVEHACFLSGLGRHAEKVENLAQRKALMVHNIPLTGGL
jgi:hypothetical protein